MLSWPVELKALIFMVIQGCSRYSTRFSFKTFLIIVQLPAYYKYSLKLFSISTGYPKSLNLAVMTYTISHCFRLCSNSKSVFSNALHKMLQVL